MFCFQISGSFCVAPSLVYVRVKTTRRERPKHRHASLGTAGSGSTGWSLTSLCKQSSHLTAAGAQGLLSRGPRGYRTEAERWPGSPDSAGQTRRGRVRSGHREGKAGLVSAPLGGGEPPGQCLLRNRRSALSHVTQPPSSEDAAGLAFCCPGRLTDAPGAAVLTMARTDRCFFDLLALLWHFGVRTQPWEQVSVVWWVLTKCRVLDHGDGSRPSCWASGAGPGACLPVPGCHISVLVACWQWHLGLLGDQPSGLACDFLKAVHWAGSGL